jgi:lactate permease
VSTCGLIQPLLDRATFMIAVPLLDHAVLNPDTGKAIAATYRVNWLGAAGTAVLISAALSAIALRLGARGFGAVCTDTARQLTRSVATIALFLAFAFLGTASGMTTALGRALAGTGTLFPFFAPIVGWIGVFITGSDTSANALFGRLQQVSADQLGVSPVLAVAANSSGGVTAKMISPQSIAVACAATGLVGREPDLLRFTLPHSVGLVLLMGVLTWLQATVFSWMVPAALPSAASASAMPALNAGAILAGAAVVAVVLMLVARRVAR